MIRTVAIVLVAALVLAHGFLLRRVHRRPQHRRRNTISQVAIAVGACALVWAAEMASYAGARSWHVSTLAAAINVYHREYKRLPETFEEIAGEGVYGGAAPYRAPTGGWTGFRGPPPHYLQANTDGLVVAVEGKTRRSGRRRRGYVILGSSSSHYASEEELTEILAKDDKRREEAGEDGRWALVEWKE